MKKTTCLIFVVISSLHMVFAQTEATSLPCEYFDNEEYFAGMASASNDESTYLDGILEGDLRSEHLTYIAYIRAIDIVVGKLREFYSYDSPRQTYENFLTKRQLVNSLAEIVCIKEQIREDDKKVIFLSIRVSRDAVTQKTLEKGKARPKLNEKKFKRQARQVFKDSIK